jgi:hypothetical protein
MTVCRVARGPAWRPHDCVAYDNRSLLHAATWFDAAARRRELWRVTAGGNPGAGFDAARPSWEISTRGVGRAAKL